MTNRVAQRIDIQVGDICQLQVDAVVNAANNTLLGGGGVDGAIHRAAGVELLEACQALQGCQTGMAKITAGFNLPADFVIHTVGPVWQGGHQGEPALLASCYQQALALAHQHGLGSIAFPAISCGVYGYPLALAAEIAVREVATYLASDSDKLRVVFCLFSEADGDIYREKLAQLS